MNTLGFSILAIVLSTSIFSQGLRDHLDPEIAAIRAVVDAYISANPARLRQAFLDSMNLYTTDEKGSLRTIPFAEYLQHVTTNSNSPQEERQATIDSIDRTGNVAVAKVTTIRPHARVTDYLSLIRIDDQWKIVNKSFFVEPRNTPAFLPTAPQSASSDRPCMTQDHRRFDFMIGNWHTSDPGSGAVAATEGESAVEALLDSCIVHEHRSVSRQGKQLFDGDAFWGYDSTTKRWLLFYMDDMSHMQVYEGREEPGHLAFYRERPDPDGKLILIRIVYAPSGSSRYTQTVERSTDHGKTWLPAGVTIYQSKH